MPIEYGGKRGRRIDVAEAELRAAEAFVADRERRLAADVRRLYVEAIAAIRELEVETSCVTATALLRITVK